MGSGKILDGICAVLDGLEAHMIRSGGRKRLQKLSKSLWPQLGPGKGLKFKSKTIDKQWLVRQLCRTCERLALEPTLRRQREALRLALVLLGAL
jgi:hypothetical protein